jgi:predicted nucleic acid-binding protein
VVFPRRIDGDVGCVLERLSAGEQALVPSFRALEVLNTLLVGERRGRITAADARSFIEKLRLLKPMFDHAARRFAGIIHLTPYDAIYVDLALRIGCPLATLDRPQRDAATALGVVCL